MIRRLFQGFFVPAQQHRLLQLQLGGAKIQSGLCSFSEKVNSLLTNGKMLHILSRRNLGEVFVPWGTYPFCLSQWPVWISSTACQGDVFLIPPVLFPWAARVLEKNRLHSGVRGFGYHHHGVCKHVLTCFIFLVQALFFVRLVNNVLQQASSSFWVRQAEREGSSWKNRRGGNFIIGSSSWIHLII